MVKRKVGYKEKEQIYNDYINSTSIADLAKQYGRPVETIEKCIKDFSAIVETTKITEQTADTSGTLRSRHFWTTLRQQLDDSELNYFEKSWVKLIKQFSQYEVVETDEMIIKDLIMMDILCNRKLKTVKSIQVELEHYEKELDLEFAKKADDRDPAKIENCMRHVSNLRGGLKDLDKSYTELQTRKEKKFSDMKSTRDKRYKEIENSKQTFFDLIKNLDTIGKRREEGEWIELMKKSVEKTTSKMSASHKFPDDNYDLPLLTPETVS